MTGEPAGTSAGTVEPVRLTRAQVREVDRLAIEVYLIPGIVLMENASRAVTAEALALMIDFRIPRALILCGGGNNGGDGLAVARHLHNRGVEVAIGLAVDPARYHGDALINWQIVKAMRLPVAEATPELVRASDALIIDAIFGTGLTEAPRNPFPALVQAITECDCPVLAVDLPSGLDCDTGQPFGPATIVADRTVTFVAEKAGFANPASRQFSGEVIVGDIGCPRELIELVRKSS
jgi:NAD(P)H-hydrate epimerase